MATIGGPANAAAQPAGGPTPTAALPVPPVNLTINSSIITGPMEELSRATRVLARQAADISNRVQNVDRAVLEGLERLDVQSENANITLSRLLASTEHLLGTTSENILQTNTRLHEANLRFLQIGNSMNSGVTRFTQASQRDAEFQAAQSEAARAATEAREALVGNVAGIATNVQTVVQRRLSDDLAIAYDWVRSSGIWIFNEVYITVSTRFLR
jgi:uncharacterized protein YukE